MGGNANHSTNTSFHFYHHENQRHAKNKTKQNKTNQIVNVALTSSKDWLGGIISIALDSSCRFRWFIAENITVFLKKVFHEKVTLNHK